MFEALFSFLFKYQLLVFEQGQFVFGATPVDVARGRLSPGSRRCTRSGPTGSSPRSRAAIASCCSAIRVALFAVVAASRCCGPMLLLKVAVPQQNFVGILLDDSRSMQVADHDGKPRSDFVHSQLGRPDAPLLTALGKRFKLRVFRFSSSAERLQSAGDLKFEGTGTRLGDALDRARDELSGLPVAGLVLVTDGSDNAERTLDESIAGLKAAGDAGVRRRASARSG